MEELQSLIIQTKRGDHDAFTEIVHRFQDMAVGYAYTILGDFHLAEDAAQEAFVSAFYLLHQLRDPSRFSGWFRKIIFKQCDRITRQDRLKIVPDETLERLPSNAQDAVQTLAEKETKELVRTAVAALPQEQRMVTTLFYINGYTQKQVADFLGISVTTVDNRLRASRKRLKERMIEMVQEDLKQNRPSRDEMLVAEVRNLTEVVLKTLKKHREEYQIQAAYVIGSLLQPQQWSASSDIDVAVSGCSQHVPAIMKALQAATGKQIDVIELETHPSPESLTKGGLKVYGQCRS